MLAAYVLVGGGALVNVGLIWFIRHVPLRPLLPQLLAQDVLNLAALLTVAKGLPYQFAFLYALPLVLAMLLLEGRQAWGLALLALMGLALSLLLSGGVPAGDGTLGGLVPPGVWQILVWLTPMLMAMIFVLYSLRVLARWMRRQEESQRRYGAIEAQNERLAMLSSFAANAAHELGSPLATISVAAEELARGLEALPAAAGPREDAALIGREVARCRAVLHDLSARAGASLAEIPAPLLLEQLEQALRASLPARLGERLEIAYQPPEGRYRQVRVPVQSLLQILRSLIRNAAEAQAGNGAADPIRLQVDVNRRLTFVIRDRGAGIAPALRARLMQPFVTTKAEQGGLGLGLYLASTFARRAGGRLRLEDEPAGGTRVELRLPLIFPEEPHA